jgi:phosphatidylglycerophosphate synthase
MQKQINSLRTFLENIDSYRDKLLFIFIKPYWPRKISPNHVTYVRAIIGLILFILLFFFGITDKALILSLFFIGVITDFIDGPVARGTNRVTEFGAMLDSTTDRLLLAPIAVYALFSFHKWLLLTLFIVELLNGVTSMHYKSKEIYLESNIFGKIKMVLMSIAFIAILLVWPLDVPSFFVLMLWFTILFSFLSALNMILELKSKQSAYEKNTN